MDGNLTHTANMVPELIWKNCLSVGLYIHCASLCNLQLSCRGVGYSASEYSGGDEPSVIIKYFRLLSIQLGITGIHVLIHIAPQQKMYSHNHVLNHLQYKANIYFSCGL